jgi:WD40 repeat protein
MVHCYLVQVNSAAVDAAGRLAVTVSADGTGRVWDLGAGRCTHVLSGPGRSSAGGCCLHFCLGVNLNSLTIRLLRDCPVQAVSGKLAAVV